MPTIPNAARVDQGGVPLKGPVTPVNNGVTYNQGRHGNAIVTLVTGVTLGTFAASTHQFNVWITQFGTSSMTQYNTNQIQDGLVWQPIRRAEQSLTFNIDWPLQVNPGLNESFTGRFPYKVSDLAGYGTGGFKAMTEFHNAIQYHQNAVAQGTTNITMDFLYFNNYSGVSVDPYGNKILSSGNTNPIVNNNLMGHNNGYDPSSLKLEPIHYQGWIQTINPLYDRFQNVYSMQYVMNVVNPAPNGGVVQGSTLGIAEGKIDAVNASFPNRLLPTAATVKNGWGSVWVGPNWTNPQPQMNIGINYDGIPQ